MADTAHDRALRILGLRPHFRRELEMKLGRAGFDGAEVNEVIEELARLGYLDDATNARAHARVLAERKGYGATRIRADLARRGASAESIAAVMADLASDAESELERARRAADVWSRKGGMEAAALARHLRRKGFEPRVIFTVFKELPSGVEGEPFAEE